MKKLSLTIAILLTSIIAFAVQYDKKTFLSLSTTAEQIAYIDSVDSFAESDNWMLSKDGKGEASIDSWKIRAKVSALLSMAHLEKSATTEQLSQSRQNAITLLKSNVNAFNNHDLIEVYMRIHEYTSAAPLLIANADKEDVISLIDKANRLFKGNTLSKEQYVSLLLKASVKPIANHKFATLTKLIDQIPVRAGDGTAVMTSEQKKQFYGNFRDLNKVTKESADFLGAVVTQYNLVK